MKENAGNDFRPSMIQNGSLSMLSNFHIILEACAHMAFDLLERNSFKQENHNDFP